MSFLKIKPMQNFVIKRNLQHPSSLLINWVTVYACRSNNLKNPFWKPRRSILVEMLKIHVFWAISYLVYRRTPVVLRICLCSILRINLLLNFCCKPNLRFAWWFFSRKEMLQAYSPKSRKSGVLAKISLKIFQMTSFKFLNM